VRRALRVWQAASAAASSKAGAARAASALLQPAGCCSRSPLQQLGGWPGGRRGLRQGPAPHLQAQQVCDRVAAVCARRGGVAAGAGLAGRQRAARGKEAGGALGAGAAAVPRGASCAWRRSWSAPLLRNEGGAGRGGSQAARQPGSQAARQPGMQGRSSTHLGTNSCGPTPRNGSRSTGCRETLRRSHSRPPRSPRHRGDAIPPRRRLSAWWRRPSAA
jgi:hypothetical protein